MLEILESNPNNPVRVLIYGGPGIGKSSFGAKSESPVFITPENGIDHLTDAFGKPVKYLKDMNSWDSIRKGISELTKEKHSFKTVVLDSADWIEKACHSRIIGNTNRSIITVGGGYGHGYREAERLHRELIEDLSDLRDKRGMNIVITSHSHVREVKDPEATSAYDRFEIKCHEMVSSLWREFVDAFLFARIKTYLKTEEGSDKAKALTDGTRVVYTQERPAFQAKNRFGLPPEMPFTEDYWKEFIKYAKKGVPDEKMEDLVQECEHLLSKIADASVLEKAQTALVNAKDLSEVKKIKIRLEQITGSK